MNSYRIVFSRPHTSHVVTTVQAHNADTAVELARAAAVNSPNWVEDNYIPRADKLDILTIELEPEFNYGY